jgi:plastocyanin
MTVINFYKPRIVVDHSDPKYKRIKFQELEIGTMNKILMIPIAIYGIILAIPVFQSSYAGGLSPIEAVIMITENQNNTVFFQPNITTIRVSGEILIANNSTSDHSVTSGSGPDDPMSGKFFNTGVIKPKGFIDYVPENLKPGNYSFYSSTDPQIKGQLVVVPNK